MAVGPRCQITVSLPAFRDNVRHAKKVLAGDAKLMVAVKSEAYGHGGLALARAALEAGADALAVLDIPQGVAIRAENPDVALLCWLHSPTSDFGAAAKAKLDLGISGIWQLELLATQAPSTQTRVHLKIDTGLHRNGALPEEWPGLVERAAQLEREGHIRVVGVWSHLADTSLDEDRSSLERFHQAVKLARHAGLTPDLLHIAASAAAADLPETRLDMVRIGIIAYGISPFEDRLAQELGFQPVMSVHATVLLHSADQRLAIVGMGFGDGLLPPAPGTGWITHEGTRYSLDAMDADMMTISTTGPQPLPPIGAQITIWGDPAGGSPRAEDWAQWAGTIGDEVVASLAHHVPRNFIDEHPAV